MATITVLHNSSRNLCKVFKSSDRPEPIDRASRFFLEQRSVEGIEEFSTLLSGLEPDPHRLIIRGAPLPETDLSRQVGRKGYEPNVSEINEQPFIDQPQPWLMLDIDKLELPSDIDILKDPLKAVAYAIEQLPTAFQDVTVHWQLSASAGLDKSRISAHLFYWLSEPATSQRLKHWGKAINLSRGAKQA